MSSLKVKILFWLAVIGVLFLLGAYMIESGYAKGYAAATEKHQAADIASLNKSIADLNAETKKAGAMNLVLHNTISARQVADQKSTQVFTNALNATAHLRFNCVFNDSIMQQLYQTADRADQAAASGISVAMPSSSPPDG